jgi:N-acetylmuramic acid 6-phosphate etherase
MKARAAGERGERRLSPANLKTERRNHRSAALDSLPALEIARIMNAEDAKVAAAVRRALPQVGGAIEWIAAALRKGGRLIYVGAGTSGRIAALDAAECPPTFNTSPRQVQYVIAGGKRALGAAVEANEDSGASGRRDVRKKAPGPGDVVVGIAASGRTPYTVAALEYARARGAKTVAVTCHPGSALAKAAHISIVTEVGPEVIAGSSRLKAGTAQKMVLNMLSTGAMARLGFVFGNLMVNVHLKNSKLKERGLAIVQQAAQVDRAAAAAALAAASDRVALALVMLRTGAKRRQAEQWLARAGGHVRQAIADAQNGTAKAASK